MPANRKAIWHGNVVPSVGKGFYLYSKALKNSLQISGSSLWVSLLYRDDALLILLTNILQVI